MTTRERSALPWAAALAGLALLALALWLTAEPLSGVLTRRTVDTIKPFLAAGATLLLFVDWLLDRIGRADFLGTLRKGLLVGLAVASTLAWWNFLQFHYPRHIHVSDTFHYYMGSKFFPELGYTRLYACTAVADAEAGPRTGVAGRRLRNLATNALETTDAVRADPSVCKRHFDAARWKEFAADVGWFRTRVTQARWNQIQRDHGYNPPPSWGVLGTALSNLGPASEAQMLALGLLDPLLLAVMFAFVARAFGWRVLCIALVYWGTNVFGVFGWTGGSFLRQAWLVAAVVGICCLRIGRPAAAGALLAVSALVRIFPAVLLATLALQAAGEMWRRRRLSLTPDDRRLLLGATLAVVTVLSASVLAYGSAQPWFGFVENSRLHLATPLKNHMGLQTVLAYDPATVERRIEGADAVERYEVWRDARLEKLAERRWIHPVLGIAFLALLALAIRGQPTWVAAVLGIGVIPVAFELTNYYYAVLIGYALLAARSVGFGVALCGVSALSWAIVSHWQWRDEFMTWCSVLVLAYVVTCTALFAASRFRTRGAEPDG